MIKGKIKIVLLAALGVSGLITPGVKADEWDQKTTFTFNQPVEIPGQVLAAGTYVFKLADSQSDRNVVQVLDKDETHLYGTFLAIPDLQLQPAGKAIVTFEERAADSPEAVKAWFYPGENFGHQFVYPQPRALALAKANNTAVPSMPGELSVNTTTPATTMNEPHVTAMRNAPLKAQQATGEEAELPGASDAPHPQPSQALP